MRFVEEVQKVQFSRFHIPDIPYFKGLLKARPARRQTICTYVFQAPCSIQNTNTKYEYKIRNLDFYFRTLDIHISHFTLCTVYCVLCTVYCVFRIAYFVSRRKLAIGDRRWAVVVKLVTFFFVVHPD